MAIGEERRKRMTEAGWIVMEAFGRVMKEYELTHAEFTAVVIQNLSGWNKLQLEQEWNEQ
jgi:hypothetical protein